MSDRARVLVADDEPSIRFVLREALEAEGHEVREVEDGDAALEVLTSERFDLALLDLRMPGQTGLQLLERLRAMQIETAVVIITAQNTMQNAVEAMRLGALDYLVKPFSLAEATALASKALQTRALQQEVRELRREVAKRAAPGGDRLVGKSAALREIFKTVGKVARSNVSVLISGESGTGKEVVARAIHAASPRSGGPFVTVNAAAIPRELLESELFGHERGAFTGAIESRAGRFREASGGSLFLDEIGDMPIELQAKLLRVLQDSEVSSVGGQQSEWVDVRIIAATHRNLEAAVEAGTFREDLLYRLRVVPMHLPPLRERPEDIRVMAEHFVAQYAEELGADVSGLSEDAIVRLEGHSWPGNVRELLNGIKRALVLGTGPVLTPDDFHFLDRETAKRRSTNLSNLVAQEVSAALSEPDPSGIYHRLLERVERPLLETVIGRTEGNQIKAAALLGINRNTLRKKIAELGIALPGRKSS